MLNILTKKDVELAPRNASLSQKTIDSLTDNDGEYKRMKILGFQNKEYRPKNHIRPRAKKTLQGFYEERMRMKSMIAQPSDQKQLDSSLRIQRLVSWGMRRRIEKDAQRRRKSAMQMFRH